MQLQLETTNCANSHEIHSMNWRLCFEVHVQLCNKSIYSLFDGGNDLAHAVPLMFDVVEAFLLPGMQLLQELQVFVVGFLQIKHTFLEETLERRSRSKYL